jgi:AICAR transformylase/IMP cyclohydrolase PurH
MYSLTISSKPSFQTVSYETVETMSIHKAENDTACKTDYLQFTTGAGASTKKCGDIDIPMTNVTDSGSLLVKFASDGGTKTTGKGFKLKVQARRRELDEGEENIRIDLAVVTKKDDRISSQNATVFFTFALASVTKWPDFMYARSTVCWLSPESR